MRTKIVAGNWKMNRTREEALKLAAEIKAAVEKENHDNLLTILAPPFPFIGEIAQSINPGKNIFVAAQNCHEENSGAFTGEVSAAMIASCGAKYVIIGHSERRKYFQENDALLKKKTFMAIENKLEVIFCVGETQEERNSGNHFHTVEMQMKNGIGAALTKFPEKIIIAYEPVWAIGTGVHATPQQAQEMHAFIRDVMRKKISDEVAEKVSVLYGGSCNAQNAKSIFSCEDVDGGLIGGASLKGEEFAEIRRAMMEVMK